MARDRQPPSTKSEPVTPEGAWRAEEFEGKWQRTLLIALPFGALAFIIGWLLERPSAQTTTLDLIGYPIMAVGLIALEIVLAVSARALRFVVHAIVASAGTFFIAKLAYLLFALPLGVDTQLQMTETFYWIPVIYLLSFLIPNVRGGRFMATTFTVLVIVIGAAGALRAVGAAYPWGVLYALIQLSLSSSVLLALTVAFIGFKERYTEARVKMEAAEAVAYVDVLTNLPNRRMAEREFDRMVEQSRRMGLKVAMLFIDIDRFKIINDTLGHETGDRLLKEMAERLEAAVRDGDFVARLSGDEFVVLTRGFRDHTSVALTVERIRSALTLPFLPGDKELTVTVSIGVAIFPDAAEDAKTLLRHADSAMYMVKRSGKNSVRYYSEETDATVERRGELERDLRVALTNGQLSLVYQPMYDLDSGDLVKVEALLRWRHPERGFIPPSEFIPLAEESGMIVAIGTWVLEEACRQRVRWREVGWQDFTMSVNVSPLQFMQTDFFGTVFKTIQATGLRPDLLELELTEGIVMGRVDDVAGVLRNLRSLGIGIAIDDFGTGYSSLAYLRDLPIDTLKIDKSFVRDLTQPLEGPQFALALIQAIMGLASHLDLQIVAEGVETPEQSELLRDLGCHVGQGYLFAEPMAADDLSNLLLPLPKGAGRTDSRLVN